MTNKALQPTLLASAPLRHERRLGIYVRPGRESQTMEHYSGSDRNEKREYARKI